VQMSVDSTVVSSYYQCSDANTTDINPIPYRLVLILNNIGIVTSLIYITTVVTLYK